jgi:hypothetical protein
MELMRIQKHCLYITDRKEQLIRYLSQNYATKTELATKVTTDNTVIQSAIIVDYLLVNDF